MEIEEWKRKHPINPDNYIELPELSAEGYIFGGWYKDPEFKRKVERIHKNKFTLPLDLHVKWIPIDELHIHCTEDHIVKTVYSKFNKKIKELNL